MTAHWAEKRDPVRREEGPSAPRVEHRYYTRGRINGKNRKGFDYNPKGFGQIFIFVSNCPWIWLKPQRF